MRVRQQANLLPEELNWLTLQYQHEPEDKTNSTGDANCSPQHKLMDIGNRQAEEGDCDGDPGQRTGPDIAGLTEPPPLRNVLACDLSSCM